MDQHAGADALGHLFGRYLQAQLAGDRREAVRIVLDEGIREGHSVGTLQAGVVQAAQREIGRLWQQNRISIAQEHMATAISHVVMSRLFEEARPEPRLGRKVVVACVAGEYHEFPARLVADFLDLGGFEVRYLGANVPLEDLVAMLHEEGADLLALSVTMSFNAPALREAAIRLRAEFPGLPLLVSERLVQYLERDGRALSQRVLQEMYRDPFWSERFGDRGRRHADEDSDYHLKYLARALANGEPHVLVRYAVWLREVLATRGMCTRHLDENFRLLALAITEQPWPAREQAVALLMVAREALLYEGGEARRLQEATDPLAREVVAAFRERQPHGWKRDARGRGALEDDAANYLSYVADALALGSPDTLVEHTRWLAVHVRKHSAAPGDMAVFLAAVQRVLAKLPQAGAFVEAAQSALGVAA